MELLLEKIKNQLIATYDPQKIILFGSAAKGLLRPDSDLDILVIGNFSTMPALRGIELHGFWHSFPMPIDVLYYTPAEIEHLFQQSDAFMVSALLNGKIFFEKK